MHKNESGRPAILSEAGLHSDWLVQPMLEAGFTVSRCTLEEVPHKLASGQYNALILGRYYTLRRTRGQEAQVVERLWSAVREFLRAGGGVFFGFPVGDVIPFTAWLEDYGVAIPVTGLDQTHDVVITDSTNSMGAKIYGYTTDVAEPFADGVDGIWYPVKLGHAIAARPVQTLNDAWHVALSGGPHSRTDRAHVSHGNAISVADADAPDYADQVPLVCVREVDAGRLCVCGIPSGYNIDSPHNCPPTKSLLFEGFEGKPSGMQRFLLNLFAWLAAPSLQSGALGGGESDADVRIPIVPRYPDDPPVRWAARDFPPDDPCPLRGLIGARSTHSTGSSSVAAYVEQARAAGLDFLVFLEDFAHLTRAGLDTLKAECVALSTDRFFAVPGYTIDDIAGGHYFQYGDSIRYIEPDLLSDDETILTVRPPDHPRWKMSRNDRVDSLHERVVLTDNKCRIRRGRYHHHDCPVLFEDQRACDSIALVTWRDGTIVDDVRDAYGEVEKRSLRLTPVALTLLQCAADIPRALADGWTNRIIEPYAVVPDKVLRKWMSPELEWWGMIDEDRVRGPRFRFDNWQTTWPAQYMTDGPEVLAWTASVTARDPEWRAPDVEIPPVADGFRLDPIGFRLRIKTRSTVGLDEVRLKDGERILRCWRPGGARTFEQELDLMHHQQMHLLLEVRDVQGKRAICLDYPTLRLDWCEFICADRNNPLSIGFEKDAQGLAYGWCGSIFLTYSDMKWGGTSQRMTRWWYNGDTIAPVPADPLQDVRLPTDGGVGAPGGRLHIMLQMPELTPPEVGLGLIFYQQLVSPDVAVDDLDFDRAGYDPQWPWFFGQERTGVGSFPAVPSRYIKLTRRAHVFRPRPHALSTVIYDYTLRWKKDPGLTAPLRMGWLDKGDRVVLIHADGTRETMPERDTTPFRTRWRRNETLVMWTEGRRPAIFFNDGTDLILERDTTWPVGTVGPCEDQHGLLALWLPVEHLPTPDRATTLRFIAFGGSFDEQDPDVGLTVSAALGLTDAPRYAVDVRQGRLCAQRLILALDGEGYGAAFRLPRTDLPAALPVTVSNLNPNWTVTLLDCARHRWRPLGVLEGTAYAVLDTTDGDWDVFVGHPVVADDDDLVLNLVQTGDRDGVLEIHNPTKRVIEACVRWTAAWERSGRSGVALRLAPGASHVVPVDFTVSENGRSQLR